MKSLGICIGATTLTVVSLARGQSEAPVVNNIHSQPHNGNPRKALIDALRKFPLNGSVRIAATGRKFRHFLNISSISEPEAVETALEKFNGDVEKINAVVSAGGETFLVYVIGKNRRICSIQTGNKCASGTGDFYVQQLRRMGITLDEAVEFSRDERPYRVSGRCSVFCKSDCTHALNKGISRQRIASGLCKMMSGKILEILRQIPKKDIMVIGGTSKNKMMVGFLKSEIPNLMIPEEAPFIEAIGAGLWAMENETIPFPGFEGLFRDEAQTFHYLPPLSQAEQLVDFRKSPETPGPGGAEFILGLDVGSTTTKAVIMRSSDQAVMSSVYLRTNGDPVGASRACYAELIKKEINGGMKIIGLGVTGSGRQIAGLHAMTQGIINEIIAHASAALNFDGEVDTILEIGGQDAKYTYIVNGVPTDYAMNDACSAGTGSFLEEAAKESLGIEMEQIADIATQGKRPPNFNDQCAAFISSDIKNASHEGIEKEDIVAGLVYSIAMNYNSRVRGNRPIGNKIFMQGGVCYNRAVPMAMAALTGKQIIVPPEPGLMGAFGVALELKHRIELGLIKKTEYSLQALRDREIEREQPFICNGGKEGCDRKCEIARIRVEGKVYPFGGACNRWYNIRSNVKIDSERINLVAVHEKIIFGKDAREENTPDETLHAPIVGINKSFLTNTFYPLYRQFFEGIGFRVALANVPEQAGMDYKGAAFCYPAEIAHGYILNLLDKRPDFLFIPHIKGLQVRDGFKKSTVCPVCQAEPYYLKSAFKHHEVFKRIKAENKLLEPIIDFSGGLKGSEPAFISMSKALGVSTGKARKAFADAMSVQNAAYREMKEEGGRFMEMLRKDPDGFAVVILGRSYNAYVSETHMGIPHKFASRGIPVVGATPCRSRMKRWAVRCTGLPGRQY